MWQDSIYNMKDTHTCTSTSGSMSSLYLVSLCERSSVMFFPCCSVWVDGCCCRSPLSQRTGAAIHTHPSTHTHLVSPPPLSISFPRLSPWLRLPRLKWVTSCWWRGALCGDLLERGGFGKVLLYLHHNTATRRWMHQQHACINVHTHTLLKVVMLEINYCIVYIGPELSCSVSLQHKTGKVGRAAAFDQNNFYRFCQNEKASCRRIHYVHQKRRLF